MIEDTLTDALSSPTRVRLTTDWYTRVGTKLFTSYYGKGWDEVEILPSENGLRRVRVGARQLRESNNGGRWEEETV
jgi:hypothetical protein